MEGDPVASLTLRAILRYNLDFRREQRGDNNWRQLLGMAATEVYRSDQVTALQARVVYYTGLMQLGAQVPGEHNILKQTFDTLQNLDDQIKQQLQPWDTPEEAERRLSAGRKSTDDLVKERIGDMADPAFRRKFNATINKVYDDLDSGKEEYNEGDDFALARAKLIELRKKQWGVR